MNIFLTGGTGFFGKALLRHWIGMELASEEVQSVTILSRDPDAFLQSYPEFKNHEWLSFHRGDILKAESLPKHGSYTHVLHAATDSTLGPRLTPLERYEQIVEGTRNILDFAVSHGVGRFLLTSSGGVYGPQPEEMDQIPEYFNGMGDSLNPKNAYSIAKRCAEHLCALYQDRYSLETVIARCFAFVGRDMPMDVHLAIGNFIKDAIQNPDIVIRGDGSPLRTYMDQRDLACWLFTLLINGNAGEAYNVGSDLEISISKLAYLIRDLLSPDKQIRIERRLIPDGTRNKYVPSIAKAKKELSLSLTYTLEESIKEAAKYLK